jgi:hypothetical protein
MFSTCGMLLNAKRISMAPFRANIVSVIHDNYPKFFPVTRTVNLGFTKVEVPMGLYYYRSNDMNCALKL